MMSACFGVGGGGSAPALTARKLGMTPRIRLGCCLLGGAPWLAGPPSGGFWSDCVGAFCEFASEGVWASGVDGGAASCPGSFKDTSVTDRDAGQSEQGASGKSDGCSAKIGVVRKKNASTVIRRKKGFLGQLIC